MIYSSQTQKLLSSDDHKTPAGFGAGELQLNFGDVKTPFECKELTRLCQILRIGSMDPLKSRGCLHDLINSNAL